MKKVMNPMILLSVVLLLLEGIQLCFSGNSRLECIEEERQALLRLKQSFKDRLNRLGSWTGGGCCHWRGVGCNQSTGHVVKLDLRTPSVFIDFRGSSKFVRLPEFNISEILLASEVHPSLEDLKQLEYLDLSGNYFNGSRIPEFIGSLKNLRYLNLSWGGFQGRIPHQLGNLTSLQVLDLRYANGYYSSFGESSLQWASSFSSLEYLDLSGADLSTTFDLIHVLSKLPSLKYLTLRYCGIANIQFSYSSINTTFLSNIQYLDLSSNSIVGSIPKDLKNMTALRYLDISRNRFNSTFPLGLVNPRSLVFLDVMGNSFKSIEGGLLSILNNACSLKSLDLSFNQFQYEVLISSPNSSSCLFYDLESLNFETNQFEGSIPNWLGQLKGLKQLSFANNSFSGPIPYSIGELPMLRNLDLSKNQLSGSIPQSMGNLLSLEILTLSSNHLNGSIPKSLGKLSSMKWLDLSNNHLNGMIPQSLGIFPILSFLDLSYNQLNGTIPQSFGKLFSLNSLFLSHNQLSGIPESLSQLVNVTSLDISSNPLEGVISELHFANLSKLAWLDISSNNLTWEFESDWNPPFNLGSVNMSYCRIGLQFPQWLQTQTLIFELDLSHSNISEDFSRLNMWISKNIYYLDLSGNQVTGSLPANIADTIPEVTDLLLGNNLMNGSFPDSICSLKMLQIIDISKNMLSGEIPDCWTKFKQLSVINLSYNKLSGTIPGSLGNLSDLRWLHLNGNNLGGQLPLGLRSCTRLELMDLGENNISGVIPAWVGESLFSLKVLRLRKNMLSGDIPLELCRLSKVQILDLALNGLSGGIPRCFGKLNGMTEEISGVKLSSSPTVARHPPPPLIVGRPPPPLIVGRPPPPLIVGRPPPPLIVGRPPPPSVSEDHWHKENAPVFTKGTSLDYTTTLLLLDGLDLSSNNLDGPIPEELCGLTGLRTLNLSHNRLIGSIPNKIGNFKSLESLDLSHNSLFGQIPQAMSVLTSLNHLNLSYNNLSGNIPTGNQLQTLDDPSIYAGNLQLCGPPLTKKCDGVDEQAKPPTSSDHGDDDRGEDRKGKILFWFFVTSGYAVGLWTVIGILVVKKNWRIAYFRFVDNTKEWILVVVAMKVKRLKQRMQRT